MGMDLPDLVFQQDLAISGRHAYQHGYNKQGLENKQAYRNRCVCYELSNILLVISLVCSVCLIWVFCLPQTTQNEPITWSQQHGQELPCQPSHEYGELYPDHMPSRNCKRLSAVKALCSHWLDTGSRMSKIRRLLKASTFWFWQSEQHYISNALFNGF